MVLCAGESINLYKQWSFGILGQKIHYGKNFIGSFVNIVLCEQYCGKE